LPEETTAPGKGERTRQRIKSAALKLFAQRGLNGVSVRDINAAAGQKNAGSINYHFSSRDDLIRELVFDVAKILDVAHNANIDALEAAGGPRTIREVVEILVQTPSMPDGRCAKDDYSSRFMNMVLISHREMLFEAMRGQDRGTRRCLAHIRRMAPEMPAEILQQRLMLVIIYLITAASSREAALVDRSAWENLWGHKSARDNLADTVVGIVCAPVSSETLESLKQEGRSTRTTETRAGKYGTH
jgi:AcrR family transcriptional regulator